MGETAAASDSTAQQRFSRTGILVMVLVVLGLALGTVVVVQQMSQLNGQVRDLSVQLQHARQVTQSKAEAVDRTLSPLVVAQVEAARDRLKAGDEGGAKAELKRAQTLARSVKELGSGTPPPKMVAELTDVETALGEPLSMPPQPKMPMGGT